MQIHMDFTFYLFQMALLGSIYFLGCDWDIWVPNESAKASVGVLDKSKYENFGIGSHFSAQFCGYFGGNFGFGKNGNLL